ncbi:Nitroreductase [Balamuthia mandrillaris]
MEKKEKDLLTLIAERHSKRNYFADKEVPAKLIQDVLLAARNAPSSRNGQPWKVEVVTGASREALSAKLCEDFDNGIPECLEYKNRPDEPDQDTAARMFEYGKEFYAMYNIERTDEAGRLRQRRLNLQFFGAPVELIFHLPANAVAGSFLEIGCFLQNVLGFHSLGLGACPQVSVASRPKVVKEHCGLGEDRLIVCGMAVGWPDMSDPINTFAPRRCELEEFATFHS